MNQRGIWQLILMAREGDRQAISDLFYASFRPAYLMLLTLVDDRDAALDFLGESYVELFENLDTIERADMFMPQLCRLILGRAQTFRSSDEPLTLGKDYASLAEAFADDPPAPHDFNTIKRLDLTGYADRMLAQCGELSVPQQICAYMYYFAELAPDTIAELLSCEEADVLGALQSVRTAVLPQIDSILQEQEAFRGTDAESALLWSLRNTAQYSVLPAKLESFFQILLDKMVASGVLDATISAQEPVPDNDDIPIREMQPLRENTLLRRIFSLRTLIVLLILLALIAGAVAFKQWRAYHARRATWNDFTERTTLSMTNSAIQLEHYIFSTEYERPTETETETQPTEAPATTEPEATTERGTPEPTAPVITSPKPGSDFSYSVNGNQLTITGYNGTRAAIEIPSTIDDKPVTAIGENAFHNASVTSVKLPSSIKAIGKGAFQSCTGLQTIALPSGITYIESNAFRGCSSLRSVTLPNTLKRIGDQAFSRCSALTSVALPETLQTIDNGAFAYCTNLTGVSIPANVTSVGSSVFYECKSLSRCAFASKSKITELGDSFFFNCTSLTGVTLPSGLKSIPAYCFIDCRSMKTVSMPSALTSIGTGAFQNCISLSSVKLPTKLTKIEASAFQGCSSLRSVSIPSGTKSIGETAFRECTNLQSVSIPASVTSIGDNAFLGCPSLVVTCPAGSAAEKYAIANHLDIYGRTTDSTESDDSNNE